MDVMKRAWGIAKAAAEKFGGSPKEYIAEALRMAWALKKAPAPHFGFSEAGKLNGSFMFVTDRVEGLKVERVWQEKNRVTGKIVTKRQEIEYKNVVNKATQQQARFYSIRHFDCPIEFSANGKVEVLTFDRRTPVWN